MIRLLKSRPQLMASFDSCDLPSRKALGCEIWNRPLKWMERATAIITGIIIIEDCGTERVVYSGPVEFDGESEMGGPVRRINVPPSDTGVSIGIVVIFPSAGSVHLYGQTQQILPGKYNVVIQVEENGRTWPFSKGLHVTAESPFAVWVES